MNGASPLESVAAFGRYLRENGYPVGLDEQAALVQATAALTPAHYRRLEACWRSIVCTNRSEWERYPELFEVYWRQQPRANVTKVSGARSRNLRTAVAALHQAMADRTGSTSLGMPGEAATDGGARDDGHAQGGASAADPLERRSIEHWGPEGHAALRALAEAVARRVRRQLTRRLRDAHRGRRLDLRRTLRRSLKYGGLPLAPAWQRRQRERPRLFILVDVSRSMELYAQIFLRVARAFSEVLHARVFVFHTRLTEVTPLLRRASDHAQEKLNAVTFGFGGGTRIATSLETFAGAQARAALSRRSIVLVCSDGYDTDPPEQLRESLRAVARRGARIYWLHPTRATALSAALATAQSFVARFAPAHDLASLQRLPELIQ